MTAIPAEAVGLKLYRINARDELIACESVRFAEGRAAIITTLNRARISGRVEIGGKIENHFADVLDADHSLIATLPGAPTP